MERLLKSMICRSALQLTALGVLACIALNGCSVSTSSTSSKMQIHFPAAAPAVSKAESTVSTSTLGFDWSRVCYLVNVTATDIEQKKSSSCDIPLGVFQGSVAPGGSMSVIVPSGTGRNVDVLVYLRTASTDPCPSFDSSSGFSTYSRTRFFRVGQTNSVDMTQATVNVEVDVSAPASGSSLVSQYQLPATCVGAVAPQGSVTSRITSGTANLTGGSGNSAISISGSISGPQSEAVLKGGSVIVHLSRKAK